MTQIPCPVPGCTRTMPAHLRVCQISAGRLLRDLADVPSLEHHLALALTRQVRLGDAGGIATAPDEVDPEVGLTLRRTGLPYDQRAREATAVLRSALVGWQRVLSTGIPATPGPTCRMCAHPSCAYIDLGRPPADTLASIAVWLLRHRARLLGHAAAAEAADEIDAAIRQARRAIDRPTELWYAGPCDVDGCTADLYARHGARTIHCRGCGAIHDALAREVWLLDQVADRLATASEIARALAAFQPGLSPSMIRGYAHRGRILARSEDELERPLYRIGDVLAIVNERMAG